MRAVFFLLLACSFPITAASEDASQVKESVREILSHIDVGGKDGCLDVHTNRICRVSADILSVSATPSLHVGEKLYSCSLYYEISATTATYSYKVHCPGVRLLPPAGESAVRANFKWLADKIKGQRV